MEYTEKKLSAYVGKRIRIKMHPFPHSVIFAELEGTLESEEVVNWYWRGDGVRKKEHLDFWIVPDQGKPVCIPWNGVRLIVEVTEI